MFLLKEGFHAFIHKNNDIRERRLFELEVGGGGEQTVSSRVIELQKGPSHHGDHTGTGPPLEIRKGKKGALSYPPVRVWIT